MNDKEKKLDTKTLNELIKTGSILLKIMLTMFILSIFVLVIYLLDKTNVLITIGRVLGILSPLFIGLLIAWLLEPGIRYFTKNKVSRKLATVVVYLIFIFLLILVIALIIPEFISQVNELIIKVPDFLKSVNTFINDAFKNTGDVDLSGIKRNLIETINNYVNNFASRNLTGIVEKLGSSIKVISNFLLGLLIAFYLSLDFSKVSKYITIVVPNRFHKDLLKIKKPLNEMLRNYVNGTLLSCLFVMILSLIGFLISGVSSPLLFAIFCAITNLIPYFGPYIGGIPVVAVGFAMNPYVGLGCLITVLIVQILEGNILNPLIVGKAVSLHPITLMLSLLVFEYFFGILGMVIAVPIVATLKIIYLFFEDKYHFINKMKER
ncbi:MAG: AI-2E family transporter [Erysipelotrichaceae bacterium]|nr:AI-2E family transporter [Erysipelotrichaceae bacterium]